MHFKITTLTKNYLLKSQHIYKKKQWQFIQHPIQRPSKAKGGIFHNLDAENGLPSLPKTVQTLPVKKKKPRKKTGGGENLYEIFSPLNESNTF